MTGWTKWSRLMRWKKPVCKICLEEMPHIAWATTSDTTLCFQRCSHSFCRVCLQQYLKNKVQAHDVEPEKLICPNLDCGQHIDSSDIYLLLGHDAFTHLLQLRSRKQLEKNPRARWCPRPGCEELILCDPSTPTFVCPKCSTKGCYHCRAIAHRFWFCPKRWQANLSETMADASYVQWEKSVGQWNSVRSCPTCHMRIWKAEGCNHMTCGKCSFEFCWACGAPWENRHYRCRDAALARQNQTAPRLIDFVFGYAAIIGIVASIVMLGTPTFVAWFILAYLLLMTSGRLGHAHALAET